MPGSIQNAETDLLAAVVKAVGGHEFLTPMNGIVCFAQLLKGRDVIISPEEQKKYGSYILRSAKRLQDMSFKITLWYRLTHHTPGEKSVFKATAADIVKLARSMSKEFGGPGEAFFLTADGAEYTLQGDQQTFFYALTETFSNAFKFAQKNTPIYLDAVTTNGCLVVTIVNTSDFTSVAQLKSHQPFIQFNREKYEQQGLGIGLQIARLCVAACNGEMKWKDLGNKKIMLELRFPLATPI